MKGADFPVVILAGGLARRLGGGDKGQRKIGGKSILAHVIERISPQAGPIILNANGDPQRFSDYSLPVVADEIQGFAGPLSGILSGMAWVAENYPRASHMLSLPSDAPFIPPDLVARLAAPIACGADMSCAESNGRHHPVVAVWKVALLNDLRAAMQKESLRKVDRFTQRYDTRPVLFDCKPVDPFYNVNREEDMKEAKRLWQRYFSD